MPKPPNPNKKFKSGVDEEITQRIFRNVYRLVPQKIEMEALKEGDLFLMLPATPDDKEKITPHELMLALADGIDEGGHVDMMGRRNASVEYEFVKVVEQKGNKPLKLTKIHEYIRGEEDWKLEE